MGGETEAQSGYLGHVPKAAHLACGRVFLIIHIRRVVYVYDLEMNTFSPDRDMR